MRPDLSHLALRATFNLTLATLMLCPRGNAQTVLIGEDFSNGGGNNLPNGWSNITAIPTSWFVGYTGTNSCMPQWNSSALLCDDELWGAGACGLTNGAKAWTIAAHPMVGTDVSISFDYFLDIDSPGGDLASVHFLTLQLGSPSPILVASSAVNLPQTGGWQSFQALVPASVIQPFVTAPWGGFQIEFRLQRASQVSKLGWAIDNLLVTASAPLTYSAGCSGNSMPCPCANFAAHGCQNSQGTSGQLLPEGASSAIVDNLSLVATELIPGNLALLVRGNPAALPWAFGAGVSCLDWPSIAPLGVRIPNAQGVATWGGPGYLAANQWSPGTALTFQVFYRDPQNSTCSAGGNNGTNTIDLTVTF